MNGSLLKRHVDALAHYQSRTVVPFGEQHSKSLQINWPFDIRGIAEEREFQALSKYLTEKLQEYYKDKITDLENTIRVEVAR